MAGLKRRPPASRDSPPGIGGCSRWLPGGGGAGRSRARAGGVGRVLRWGWGGPRGRRAPSTPRAPPQPLEIKLAALAGLGRPRRRGRRAAGGDLARGRGSAPAARRPAARAPPPLPPRPAARRLFPGRQAGGAALLLNPPAGGFSPFRARGGERGSGLTSGRCAGLGALAPAAGSPAPRCLRSGRRQRADRVTFLSCYLPVAGDKARLPRLLELVLEAPEDLVEEESSTGWSGFSRATTEF